MIPSLAVPPRMTVFRRCLIPLLVLASPVRAEVDFLILDSAKPGPTVMVHAPEEGAGRVALRQLRHRPPARGRLVLARLDDGLERPGSGEADGWESAPFFSDLAARFPASQVLVFREDGEARAYDPRFRGDTVQGNDRASSAVLKALRGLEAEIEGKDWQALPGEGRERETVVTTNARVHMEAGLRPAVQEREFRTAACALLSHLDMADEDTGKLRLFPAALPGRIRVAVYDGSGAQSPTGRGPSWLRSRLEREAGLDVELTGVPEILQGALDHADVLVMGGGKSNLESKALGEKGRAEVIRFVREGGGYVGICAGAYLGSSGSGKVACLGLLPVKTGATWLGCHTPLAWSDSPLGATRVEDADLRGGPTFQLMENAADRVDVWANFDRNETHAEKGEYQLKGTPAVISGIHGKGRVVLTSTHCERPPSPSTHFPAMVRWAGRGVPDAGE